MVAPRTAKRFWQAVAAIVLVAGLPAAEGMAAEEPKPLEGFYVVPSLQISPELPDVRPGIPVELTARLSHPVLGDTPVQFKLFTLSGRERYSRLKPPPLETPECIVPAGELTCTITLVRHATSALIVRGWLSEIGLPPDTREGRLSSLNLFLHPGADCRLEDGEPVDDKCRGGLNSQVQPGELAEPDTTDVVLVGWTGTAAAFVDCDDTGPDGGTELEHRPVDQRTVTYVCTLTNRITGEPIVGGRLAGEVMGGPFDDDSRGSARSDYGTYPYHPETHRTCTTTAPQGHCSFELTVPGDGPGEMVLCLWADGDNDGFYTEDDNDGGGCSDEAFDEEPEANDGTDTVVISLR